MLHDASKDCLKKLRARVETQPELSVVVMSSLISTPGTPFFDRITKTKTLEEVFSLADGKSFSNILKMLEHVMNNQQGKDKKGAENARHAIADLILASFRIKTKGNKNDALEGSSWISDAIKLFLRWGYCIPRPSKLPDEIPSPEVSSETRAMIHSRLSSLLGQLLSSQSSNISYWAWQAVRKLKSMTKSSKSYRMVLQPDDTIIEILNRAYSFAERIEHSEKKNDSSSFGKAISLLFCLLLLQAYSEDTNAIPELEDLNTCYQSISSSEQSGIHFDLLLEILLGLLSKPSSLFRSMVEQVFTAISSSITEGALQSLIDILQTSESLVGERDLFQSNPNVVVDENEEDSELDSDVEMIDQTNKSSESTDGSSDDDESDEDSPEDDEEEDEELIQFNEKLAKVFQTSKAGNDDNSTNEDSDGESMDDDQMMALDSQIAHIFRERHIQPNKQKEKNDARQNVINFKRRVLDLLSIYVKQESDNSLALYTLVPLLELIRTTKEKSLETKASDVLKLYYNTCSKNKKLPRPTDTSSAWDILKLIHSEVQKNGSKFHCSSCSRASLFVVKVLVSLDRKNYDQAAEVYSITQKTWFHKKSIVVQPTFFTEWISWSAEMRKQK
jgi:DNA polymerase phi